MINRNYYLLSFLLIMLFPAYGFAQQGAGCTRSVPEPVIKKNTLSDYSFNFHADSLTATENAKLKNGDKLMITHQGCEYYVLTFRFETQRFQHDTTDASLQARVFVSRTGWQTWDHQYHRKGAHSAKLRLYLDI